MKYSIVTFGCRVNQADSFVIEEELRRRGGVDVAPEDADLVVVNTCSVTATADQGARQTIRRIVRSNPHVKVVVTGCYATRRPDELRELPNVVRVVPNDDTAQKVRAAAQRYVSDKDNVINQLQVAGSSQVNLRVRVAEVSRSVTKQLGFNWETLSTIGSFSFGLSRITVESTFTSS